MEPAAGEGREGSFRSFLTIWLGQAVSALGSSLTSFGLGVWVFDTTGSATAYSLIAFAVVLPDILVSPLAGALVDRIDRRRLMIVGDGGAGFCTLVLAVLVYAGELRLWNIYLLVAVSSVCQTVQFLSLSASVVLLVPRRHLGRASGLTGLGLSMAGILGPLLASYLLGRIGLRGLILLDVASFLVAVTAVALVRVPRPRSGLESGGRRPLLEDAAFGWRYLRESKGLLALLALFALSNFSGGMVGTLITPLVLSFASAQDLGGVLAASSCGLAAGALLMSIWGGPVRRVGGILRVISFQGLILLFGGLRPSVVFVGTAAFLFLFGTPIATGCSQVIWQMKVPEELQGRVFAFRRILGLATLPLAYLTAGPLADFVFEPLLAEGGSWEDTVGRVVGTGQGRGIGLMFVFLGLLVLLAAAVGSRYTPLRQLEEVDITSTQPVPR